MKFLARGGCIRGHRAVKRMAAFAAVKLGVFAEFLLGLFLLSTEGESQRMVVVPTLQVSNAKLAFGILLITGALAGLFVFNLQCFSAHGGTLFPKNIQASPYYSNRLPKSTLMDYR
jgi:hypothetical protein